MSLSIPSTLTETDRSLIEQTYESTDAIIQDLESGNIPDGISADDLILYVLSSTSDASWLDPENTGLEYLWTNSSVQEALSDLRMQNMSNAEFDYLIQDIEEFLDAGGQASDAVNDAQSIIDDYVNKYGPIMTEGTAATDDELANLVEFFKNTNPYIYLLLYIMQKLGPEVEDAQKVVLEKTDDNLETIDELVGDLENGDYEDADEQGELKAIEYEIQNLKQVQTSYDEVLKLLSEFVESALEVASSGIQRTSSATRSIIQNMG